MRKCSKPELILTQPTTPTVSHSTGWFEVPYLELNIADSFEIFEVKPWYPQIHPLNHNPTHSIIYSVTSIGIYMAGQWPFRFAISNIISGLWSQDVWWYLRQANTEGLFCDECVLNYLREAWSKVRGHNLQHLLNTHVYHSRIYYLILI